MIKIFDNFINDSSLITGFFDKYIMEGHLHLSFSNSGNDDFVHSFTSSLDQKDFILPLIYDIYKKCNQLLLGPNMKIYRWHANVYPSGFDGTIHTDSTYNTPTFLYCVCPWKPEWGGEFIVYDENKEAKEVASFKQDRLIVFDGKYPHRATAPTRISSLLRTTIALQTVILEK